MSNTTEIAQDNPAHIAARAIFMAAITEYEDRYRLPDDIVTREVLEPDMVLADELIVISRLSGPSRPGSALAVHILSLQTSLMVIGPFQRPWSPVDPRAGGGRPVRPAV